MKITIRLLGAIWIAALVILGGFAFFQVREERQRLLEDLQRRAALLAEGLKESVEPALRRESTPAIARIVKRFGRPDRRIVVYDHVASPLATAPAAATPAAPSPPEVTDALTRSVVGRGFRMVGGTQTYVYATPLVSDERTIGALAVFLDATHLDDAERGLWQYNAVRFFVLALALSVITLAIVRASLTRPLSEMTGWARALKTGRPEPPPDRADAKLFGPLALEVAGLAQNLYRAQAAAEQEAALRLSGEALWTEERLKQFVRARLNGQAIFVVSNREPVSHVWQAGRIQMQWPASGVVTAMEPVMRACGGVWVAHGSGDADPETADAEGRLGLPIGDPRYTLRRVWLSKDEEDGYYYGFANEGLWPLCHVVHARPTFRAEDWAHYRAVNQLFATAVLAEMAGARAPLVLIQDYHLALVPALVKAARPDARVALFWHIPWPNFEAFGICPWQEQILHGMLGADLIGFHTQYHCNNFLESVDRVLEARIDPEHFAVVRGDRSTYVKPFPISVAPEFVEDPPPTSRQAFLDELGIRAEFLGVGVERVDYTKGLVERFLALRRFFEINPRYRERVVFVQLAAPSRSRIPRYQELQRDVQATVDAVNRALGTRSWRPIIYDQRHYDRPQIWPFYRHADFCLVTSLHDGMNLVAKEFVSVRDDDGGVLILSRFTGAAREMRDALLVNPYDVNGTAEAIRTALEMPAEERTLRMRRMRQWVREHNIYRWAGLLLGELARIPETTDVRPS
ncbi:MAG: trehalose-6-phosphate synthase [Candidatus Rokuibacteriota bacterium]